MKFTADAQTSADRYHIPGAYEHALLAAAQLRAGPDYRVLLAADGERRLAREKRDATKRVAALMEQLRGDEIDTPRWLLSGNTIGPLREDAPAWLRVGGGDDGRLIRVYPDDSVEPAPPDSG